MLQISSFWEPGDELVIDLLPSDNPQSSLRQRRQERPNTTLPQYLNEQLPKRFARAFSELQQWDQPLQHYGNRDIDTIAQTLKQWTIRPAGTEGYRTAEVTLGGVDTRALSSQTMEVRDQPGLFFIGEVVDVTGHLGGHNFQWAWASGVAAGQAC